MWAGLLEGLILKLKLQYFGHLMRRVDSLEKTLMLGGIGGRRRRGWQRMRLLDGITDLMGMNLSRLWGFVMDREAWRAEIHGVTKSRTRLSNWTELKEMTLINHWFPEASIFLLQSRLIHVYSYCRVIILSFFFLIFFFYFSLLIILPHLAGVHPQITCKEVTFYIWSKKSKIWVLVCLMISLFSYTDWKFGYRTLSWKFEI